MCDFAGAGVLLEGPQNPKNVLSRLINSMYRFTSDKPASPALRSSQNRMSACFDKTSSLNYDRTNKSNPATSTSMNDTRKSYY